MSAGRRLVATEEALSEVGLVVWLSLVVGFLRLCTCSFCVTCQAVS